jgi:hypothetical protein
MARLGLSLLAAGLTMLMAQGCSQTEPAPKDFILAGQRPAQAAETKNSLAEAERACKAETRRKGMNSVVGIFSRLRQGATDDDFIACMKGRGYEVKS